MEGTENTERTILNKFREFSVFSVSVIDKRIAYSLPERYAQARMNRNKNKKMKITRPAAKKHPKSCPPGFGSCSSPMDRIISLNPRKF
jgi:hypothetical protein